VTQQVYARAMESSSLAYQTFHPDSEKSSGNETRRAPHSIQNARLQSISCLRESGPRVSTLQATTEECSAN